VDSVFSINTILAFVGLVVGTGIGMAAFALVIDGERGQIYRLIADRRPWLRIVSILWIVACGAAVAFVAYRLAG